MAGEEWARRIVEKELGRSVVVNDVAVEMACMTSALVQQMLLS